MLHHRVRALAAHVTDAANSLRLARPAPDAVPEVLADRQRFATEPVVLLVGRRRLGRARSRSRRTERAARVGEHAGTDVPAPAAGQCPVGAALSVPIPCSNAPGAGRKRSHQWTQSGRTTSGRCHDATGDSARAATAARRSRESGRCRHSGRYDFDARSEATTIPSPRTSTAAASGSSRGCRSCCFWRKSEPGRSDAATRIDAAANIGSSGTTSSAIHVGATATTTTTTTTAAAAATTAAAATRGCCDCRSPNSRNLDLFFLSRRQQLSTKIYRQFCCTWSAKFRGRTTSSSRRRRRRRRSRRSTWRHPRSPNAPAARDAPLRVAAPAPRTRV